MHTGSRAACFLMALAATGVECASAATEVAPEHYRVEAKMVSLPASAAQDFFASAPHSHLDSNEQVARLIGAPKSAALSLPSVDAARTSPARIAVTRSISFPHSASREVGVTLNVAPLGKSSDLDLFFVSVEDVRFAGFEDRTATKPVINERGLNTSVAENQHYWCISLPPLHKSRVTYDTDGRVTASIADANERQLLFVKITRG